MNARTETQSDMGDLDTDTASEATTRAPTSARSRSRRSRRHHHHHRSAPRVVPVIVAVVASMVVLAAVVVYAFSAISASEDTRARLQEDLYKKEEELRATTAELQSIREELATLTEERLPHLMRLEYDAVLPIHEGYVKNVLFTVIRQGSERAYEYKLVMENNGTRKVQPNIRVMLFDRTGVQVGTGVINGIDALFPGDSAAHTAMVDVSRNSPPEYFLIVSEGG